jgi:transmembrane 9 superfamily protein 3
MTYSIKWKSGHARRYKDLPADRQVHRYALINSALLVCLLVILISFLLNRILARDYNRYIQEVAFDGFEIDLGTEQGWKALHGDVFRPAANFPILAVLAGSGVHLAFFALIHGILCLHSSLKHSGEVEWTAQYLLGSFVASSPIAGFAAVSLGRAFGYQKWLRLALGATLSTPFFLILIYSVVGIFGFFTGSAHTASPFVLLFFIPMEAVVVICGIRGALFALKLKLFEMNKCEVSLIPRPIPSTPWYVRPWSISIPIGLLCAMSVAFELYYLFRSMWQFGETIVWTYFLGAVFLLIAVTTCVTVLGVYFLLQNEIHHWQWPSFFAPASSCIWVFLGAVVYVVFFGKIRGFASLVYYFLCMGTFSLGIGVMCGGIGFLSGNVFVHRIFGSMKLD